MNSHKRQKTSNPRFRLFNLLTVPQTPKQQNLFTLYLTDIYRMLTLCQTVRPVLYKYSFNPSSRPLREVCLPLSYRWRNWGMESKLLAARLELGCDSKKLWGPRCFFFFILTQGWGVYGFFLKERVREIGVREKERERETCERDTWIGCLPHAPWPGIKPTAFWCMERRSNWVTRPGHPGWS